MQRPLYGLAVDLTPDAVIGPAPYTPPSAVGVGPTASVRVAAPSSVAAPPTQRPQRLAKPRPDPARLVAAAVAQTQRRIMCGSGNPALEVPTGAYVFMASACYTDQQGTRICNSIARDLTLQ